MSEGKRVKTALSFIDTAARMELTMHWLEEWKQNQSEHIRVELALALINTIEQLEVAELNAKQLVQELAPEAYAKKGNKKKSKNLYV